MGEAFSRALGRILPLLGIGIITGLAAGIGFVLCIAPGLMVACRVYVAPPVCVVEQLGVFASIRRAEALSSGYRWKILGLFLVIVFVSVLLGFGMGLVIVAVNNPFVKVIIEALVQIVSGAWGAIAVSLAYYHLRSIKESFDIESVAAVFD